jgi:hypothetical protein
MKSGWKKERRRGGTGTDKLSLQHAEADYNIVRIRREEIKSEKRKRKEREKEERKTKVGG